MERVTNARWCFWFPGEPGCLAGGFSHLILSSLLGDRWQTVPIRSTGIPDILWRADGRTLILTLGILLPNEETSPLQRCTVCGSSPPVSHDTDPHCSSLEYQVITHFPGLTPT
jgi:hypothetical protein